MYDINAKSTACEEDQTDPYQQIVSEFKEWSRKTVRPRGTESAEVVTIIKTTALRGQGIEGDPVRIVVQYWGFDGTKLAEHDPTKED